LILFLDSAAQQHVNLVEKSPTRFGSANLAPLVARPWAFAAKRIILYLKRFYAIFEKMKIGGYYDRYFAFERDEHTGQNINDGIHMGRLMPKCR
jgi:hypothetical protein